MSTSRRGLLFEHFDKYFPPDSEIAERSVLLIDYCVSGESLAATDYYLEEYLKLRHRDSAPAPAPAPAPASAPVSASVSVSAPVSAPVSVSV